MQVGYATSTDGISWTKHASNPVFNDPTWATGATENWGVMKVGSEYLMWYTNFGMRQSGIAVSTDLVNWTPHTTGPIFASSGIASDDRYSQFCPPVSPMAATTTFSSRLTTAVATTRSSISTAHRAPTSPKRTGTWSGGSHRGRGRPVG